MGRYPNSNVVYSFGPGPMTPAVRAIVYANIAVYVINFVVSGQLTVTFGLIPEAVLTQGRVWQLATYLFLHGDIWHILFNMLTVWMFGVDLERRWGTQGFATYYGIVGVGAGVATMLVSLLPFEATAEIYYAVTIGASGAAYGLLMAWAIIFPERTVLFMGVFPLRARVFVLIMGTIVFFSAAADSGGRIAHFAHLGGLVAGWLYLKGPRVPKRRRPTHLTRVH